MTASSTVQRAVEKAHTTQDSLNAFTYIDEERSLERARLLDGARPERADEAPLWGVPVALKDLIDHEDRTTTCGSAFYRHLATETAPCVAALEEAGAVVIGRAGLHEFAFGFSSENPHWGPVRNPWDIATSPGGSSGGSAVAVAAGITPIAVGTDTGGSIRVPAALCGVFGLKVTHGRIPTRGVFPLAESIDTVGPLADSMEGIALAYRVMSGDTSPEPGPTSLRFGVPEPWFSQAPMEAGVAAAFEDLVGDLRSSGHEVHPIQMPDVVPSRSIIFAIAEEVRSVHVDFRARGEPYGEDIATRLDDVEQVTIEEALSGREWQNMIRARFSDAFHTVDFLITPTVPVRSKIIGEDMIGDHHYRSVLSYFTALVNHALHPALALPIAGSGRPPASLQVIGPLLSEARLIALGRELEREGRVAYRPPDPSTKPAG